MMFEPRASNQQQNYDNEEALFRGRENKHSKQSFHFA